MAKKKGFLFYGTLHGCPHGEDLYQTPEEVTGAEGCAEDDVLTFHGFFFKTPGGEFWGPYDNETDAKNDARVEVGIELQNQDTAPVRGSFYATNKELIYVTDLDSVWLLSDYMTATSWRLLKQPKQLQVMPKARRLPKSWLDQQPNGKHIREKLRMIPDWARK